MNGIQFKKNLVLIIVFGGIAALINIFRLPLFFEAEFVFGPFLVLLIAVFRGPVAGVLASFIATIPLVMAWGNFWPILTFGLEALFVGYVFSLKRINVILLVIIYWMFVGMPISWYSISQYDLFSDSHRISILIKQLTNGILYAHIAALFMYQSNVRRFLRMDMQINSISIKEQSSHIISSLLITVGILFFFYGLNQNIKNSSEKFYIEHQFKHNELSFKLAHMLNSKIEAIDEFKYAISSAWDDIEERQELLLAFNLRHPEFMTMVLTDHDGLLVESSPVELVEGLTEKNETISVSDRDYFQQTINNSNVYLSPGFFGRGFGNNLIAAVSAGVPNTNDAQNNIGVVEGTIALKSLNKIQQIVDDIKPDVKAVLIDQNNRVVIASKGMSIDTAQVFIFEKMENKTYKKNLVSIVNSVGEKSPEIYYLEESVLDFNWKLVTLLNDSQFATVIEKTLIAFAVSITLLVLVAKFLAWSISHSWSYSMQRLNQMIEHGNDFNEKVAEFESNDSLPIEVSNLYQEIKTSRLEILKMNRELQNTVAERTEKLQLVNRQLNVMARQDALTQLENRRVFTEVMQQLWLDCQQNLISMSMVIIDIDHFKKVNDSFGHPVGDDVLVQVARELEKFNRSTIKCMARIGGEEFCMLLKGVEHTDVAQLAEDFRLHVEKTTFHIRGDKDLQITVSVGLATIDTTKFTAAKLYQLADNALYEAKHTGRNQIKAVELI